MSAGDREHECGHCSCYHTGQASIMPSWPAANGVCCSCRLTSDQTTKETR